MCLSQGPRVRSVGTRGMTPTKIGTILVLNGKPVHTDFQPRGALANTPTIALNIRQTLTGRPGIPSSRGERALWEKAPGGAKNASVLATYHDCVFGILGYQLMLIV